MPAIDAHVSANCRKVEWVGTFAGELASRVDLALRAAVCLADGDAVEPNPSVICSSSLNAWAS
jgi:hypothetical protein